MVAEAACKRLVCYPATYVIETMGMVRWRFVETDYGVRPTNDDILAALKSLD